MATKFVAPVTALALLVIASSVGKLSGEKSLLSQRKNPRQLMFAEEDSQPWTIKWLGKWSMCTQFYAVSLPSACTKSCAMSNFEKQKIVARKAISFL